MLEVKNLTVGYRTERGLVKAVNDVSFTLDKGKILGLVGESGCGKSTILYAVLGLIKAPGSVLNGEILYHGKNILKNHSENWRNIRGKEISIIFQDPMSTLNPAYRVGKQIREMIVEHRSSKSKIFQHMQIRRKEKARVIQLMKDVGIPDAEKRYEDYPHQFSGGMQQRALISMAIACNPKILLADEPTTALDVTIQAQILDLLKQINEDYQTSMILVTHDLAVATEFCDQIAVMYAGRIVEYGQAKEIIRQPKHPYTQGLLRSIPHISKVKRKIDPIPGNVIDLIDLKDECEFMDRCAFANEQCRKFVELTPVKDDHLVRCVLYEKGSEMNDYIGIN